VPFAIFPGIFSSIDAYTKHVVQHYFDTHGRPPPWLVGLGPIAGYRPRRTTRVSAGTRAARTFCSPGLPTGFSLTATAR
jgi:hypothetical protein